MNQLHTLPPFYCKQSEILILGSFPSVKSRQSGFYYGHAQNRFWTVLAAVYDEPVPQSIEQKKALLARHRIALWDVVASCDIEGSSDSSIKNAQPNDIEWLISQCHISKIILNGKTAQRLYERFFDCDLAALPSTSPANAAWSLDRLINEWKSKLV